MPYPLPPWLDVQPQFFTSALEAGARAGIAVADQQQRAQQIAEARAGRQAQMQQRADEQAQRAQEFEQTRLLNIQKVAQDAQQLQQQIAHQTAQEANQNAQESRLLNFDTGRLAVENKRADLAARQAALPTTWHPAVPAAGDTAAVPGYFTLPNGRINVPPASATDAFSPTNTGEPIYAPDGKTLLGYGVSVGSHSRRIMAGPTTGKLSDADKAYDTRLQHEAMALERLTQNAIWQAQEEDHKAEHDKVRARLAEIDQHFEGRGQPSAVVPAPTVLGATNAVPAIGATNRTVGVTGTIHPMPATKAGLVTGQIYDTPRGAAQWDGAKFKLVEAR